jgi:hypothetical protein
VRAFKAGCLLLAVAFAIDVAAIFLDAFGSVEDVLRSYLLGGAASTIGILSLACFAQAVPPKQGFLARYGTSIFWVLVASSAAFYVYPFVAWLLDFAHSQGLWRLASLAMWAALGWAVAGRPLERGSWAVRVGPMVAGGGCIVSLIVGLALSWGGSFEVYDRAVFPFQVAGLLALLAAALSFGAQRR